MLRGLSATLWSHHLPSSECLAVLNEEYIFLIIPVSLIHPRLWSSCCCENIVVFALSSDLLEADPGFWSIEVDFLFVVQLIRRQKRTKIS